MATVVASLAAFVAGCGLPALPDGVGGNRVGRNLEDRERKLSTESCTDMEYSTLPTPARRRAHAKPVDAPPPAQAPAVVEGQEKAAEMAADARLAGKLPRTSTSAAAAAAAGRARHVKFDLARSTVHEITPYAEVYGVHPRDFHFGKGLPAPAPCFVDPGAVQAICAASAAAGLRGYDLDSDDEIDEEEGLTVAGLKLLNPGGLTACKRVPRHVWALCCICFFMLRAFGASALFDIVAPGLSQLRA